jgi:hypothetical protein
VIVESRFPSAFSRLRPKLWIDGQRAHESTLCIEEATVVRELSVTEETGQHGQRARRQSLIDEWLLPV